MAKLLCLLLVMLVSSLTIAQYQLEELDKDVKRFQQALRGFASGMYNRVAQDTADNIFFSPSSISHTMGMVLSGTKGNTTKEMKRAMRLLRDNTDFTQAELNKLFEDQFKEKFELSTNQEPSTNLVISIMASRIFIQKGFDIFPNYTDILQKHYFAEAEEINYNLPVEAAKRINTWVEQQTANLIKDLVQPKMFTPLTRLTLVNALYFKASWFAPFYDAGPQNFLTPAGNVTVPFIRSMSDFRYKDGEKITFIGIPYADGETFLTIFMPKNEKAMESFTQKAVLETFLTNFRRRFSTWNEERLDLEMPEFTIEKDMNVKTILRKMFVRELFSAAKANLSGMAKEFLYVTHFVHKARITANKEGTEAAAATAAVAAGRSLVMSTKVIVNRPFLFAIYKNGEILFLGRMVDPSQK